MTMTTKTKTTMMMKTRERRGRHKHTHTHTQFQRINKKGTEIQDEEKKEGWSEEVKGLRNKVQ